MSKKQKLTDLLLTVLQRLNEMELKQNKDAELFLNEAATLKDQIKRTEKRLLRATSYHASNVVNIVGPRTTERKDQVMRVVKLLAEDPKLTPYKACLAAFGDTPTPNGYTSTHELYQWCLRHEDEVAGWVDTYRLENL